MGLEAALPVDNIVTTQLNRVINWSRRSSLWPMPFATACCGIELMATACSRYDLARFGAEVLRTSPRQADLMIVAGRVAIKMLPVLQRIYLQMCEPKWVISMGACASTGGVFDTYAVVQGVDQFLPVDVYVPGCPPRPETLLEGLMAIQRIVVRYGVKTSEEQGEGRSQGGALGQGQIDEDHSPADHVQAHVTVQRSDHQAGEEGQRQDGGGLGQSIHCSLPPWWVS